MYIVIKILDGINREELVVLFVRVVLPKCGNGLKNALKNMAAPQMMPCKASIRIKIRKIKKANYENRNIIRKQTFSAYTRNRI